jgi:hypothetical protein
MYGKNVEKIVNSLNVIKLSKNENIFALKDKKNCIFA